MELKRNDGVVEVKHNGLSISIHAVVRINQGQQWSEVVLEGPFFLNIFWMPTRDLEYSWLLRLLLYWTCEWSELYVIHMIYVVIVVWPSWLYDKKTSHRMSVFCNQCGRPNRYDSKQVLPYDSVGSSTSGGRDFDCDQVAPHYLVARTTAQNLGLRFCRYEHQHLVGIWYG